MSAGERLYGLVEAEAKKRQGTRTDLDKHSGKLPEGITGDTRDIVAKQVGMSGKTYEKAKQSDDRAVAPHSARITNPKFHISYFQKRRDPYRNTTQNIPHVRPMGSPADLKKRTNNAHQNNAVASNSFKKLRGKRGVYITG